MILVTWILTVLLACGGYLVWANNLDILLRPNELGDFLSGLAALLSLPSILIIMLENKRTQQQRAKQEAEANSLR